MMNVANYWNPFLVLEDGYLARCNRSSFHFLGRRLTADEATSAL